MRYDTGAQARADAEKKMNDEGWKVIERNKRRRRSMREEALPRQDVQRRDMRESSSQTNIAHKRRLTVTSCCHQGWTDGQGTRPGSLDTIDDLLSGCDSEVDDGTDHTRQPSADTEDSITTADYADADLTRGVSPEDWGMLGAVGEVMAVQGERSQLGQGQVVKITVESGVAEVVAPPTFAAEYSTRPSPGSKAGTKYRTASGSIVANLGEKRVKMRIEDGDAPVMTFQVADVTKPLASAGRITSRGHRILLDDDDDDDAYIQHKESKRKVRLHKKGNAFVMRMRVMPPHDDQKASDIKKESARVLGEQGFTRQED